MFFVSPLSLCALRLLFHLCDFRFHRFDQLCELFLAFLSCGGIDVSRDVLAISVGGREPSFVEVVVDHRHATCATLAYLALVGLNFLPRRSFFGGVLLALGGSTLCVNSGICASVPPISHSILSAAYCCIVSVMWLYIFSVVSELI